MMELFTSSTPQSTGNPHSSSSLNLYLMLLPHNSLFSDLLKNPLIVPLKVLRGHGVKGGIGVHSLAFHPKQPWIFSAGADGVINLYQDVY
jgi:WD40 repeat protein